MALCAIISCASQGCAGAKSRGASEPRPRAVRQLYLQGLHFRRPSGPGADPRVGPGGPDYFGSPLPDSRLDCRPHEALHSGAPVEKIRACIAGLPPGTRVSFRLRREPVPELVLDGPDESDKPELLPPCFRELLGRVPVPREIFFQSREEGELLCYSSRVNIEADEIRALGVKWPLSKTVLNVTFPISEAPGGAPGSAGEIDIRSLLLSWSLAPFFKEGKSELEAFIVPDRICQVCLGEKAFLGPNDPAPPAWPDQ